VSGIRDYAIYSITINAVLEKLGGHISSLHNNNGDRTEQRKHHKSRELLLETGEFSHKVITTLSATSTRVLYSSPLKLYAISIQQKRRYFCNRFARSMKAGTANNESKCLYTRIVKDDPLESNLLARKQVQKMSRARMMVMSAINVVHAPLK
jgi:hypothetical protein